MKYRRIATEIVDVEPFTYLVKPHIGQEYQITAEELEKDFELAEKQPTYIIEYSEVGCNWTRSGNKNTAGTFTSLEYAKKVAAAEQKEMGSNYLYRAVPKP